MTIKIETHKGDVFRETAGLPMRPSEVAIFSTTANIDMGEFLTLLAEMAEFDGEACALPEGLLRWKVTVQDMRPRSR